MTDNSKTDIQILIEDIKSIKSSEDLLSEEIIFRYFDIPQEDIIERQKCMQALREKARKFNAVRALESTIKEYNTRMCSDMSQGLRYEYPEYITVQYNKYGGFNLTVNPALLAEYIRKNCSYLLVRDNMSNSTRMFWYDDGVYKQVSEDELQGYIKEYIESVDKSIVKMKDVKEVAAHIKTDLNVINEDELNDNENIINFQNGLLDLTDGTLQPHTSKILSTIQIPCYYDPETDKAPTFNKFLNELTGNRSDVKRFLLQWIGVSISNVKGSRLKKALFMYGPGNTGKSQLLRLVQMLLGRKNYSAIDLSELEKRFGTNNLYMKRLSGCGDVSYVGISELKIFKQVTGGENIFAEPKGKDGFYFVYQGLLWYCMNELPRFGGDRGKWVYDRIVIIKCDNVIPEERQDKQLLQKMYEERSGIINMVVPELMHVVKNNYHFDIPLSSDELKEKYIFANSPIRQFYTECCVMRSGKTIRDNCTTGKMYDVFKAWYIKNCNHNTVPSNQKFRKELAEIHDTDDISQLEIRKEHGRYYTFTLKYETKKEFQRDYGYDTVDDN